MKTLLLAIALGLMTTVALAADQTTLLSSFEQESSEEVVFAGGTRVEEHATDGKMAVKLVSDKEKYAKIEVASALFASKTFPGHDRMLVDVFNPQDKEVSFDLKVLDSKSKSGENKTWFMSSVSVKPGKSTLEIDLKALVREGSRKTDEPEKLNVADVQCLVLMILPRPDEVTVFLDNVRLAKPAGADTPTTAPAPAPAG